MFAMAAGRSRGNGAAATASMEFSSTRTRVSLKAGGSLASGSTTTTTTTTATSAVESTSSVVTGTSDEQAVAGNASDDEDDASAVSPASEVDAGDGDDEDTAAAAASALESEDENEWEDIEYDEPVFRDLKFPEDDDAAADVSDSEYAPSEANDESDDEEENVSDLDDEEEEASAAGLFANVLRRFGRHKRHTSTAPGDFDDPNAFTDADRVYWASADAKAEWAARFNAANTQFVHTYGCRIDSPALPEANAKLLREKKKRSAYTLVLFALCVAYFVQLVVMYVAAPRRPSLDAVSSAVASVTTAIANVWYPLDAFVLRNQTSSVSPDAVGSTDSERVVAVSPAVVDSAITTSSSTSHDNLVASVETPETEADTESRSESESVSAAAAVEHCSKLLTRVVKATKRTSAIRDSAVRACDAAVALAPLASPTLVEALVLRGDLFSLASDFDTAAGDYERASAVYASLPSRRTALASELELKALANRWIQLFVQKRRKELRLALTHAAKRSSSPLHTLAAAWLEALKTKQHQQLTDVLTATRMWTHERLVYSEE